MRRDSRTWDRLSERSFQIDRSHGMDRLQTMDGPRSIGLETCKLSCAQFYDDLNIQFLLSISSDFDIIFSSLLLALFTYDGHIGKNYLKDNNWQKENKPNAKSIAISS